MRAPASISYMSFPLPQHGPPLRIVDLFAGPGGLDVAASLLGVRSVGIELDAGACETREAAGLETVQGDVRDYGPADFPSFNVLAGGPPCQTFTVAGKGAGRKALSEVEELAARMADSPDVAGGLAVFDDERTGLVLEPLRWVLEALRLDRPYEAVVLEQVPAVLPIWEAFRVVLLRFGYSVDVGVLKTEEFGVPQTRRRAVLIARLGEDLVELPRPTHQTFRRGNPVQEMLGLERWVSMDEVLNRKGPFTVVSNYGSGGDPKNRGRRDSDEPSATVTGKVMRNRLVFPDGTWGRLSHQEAGQLQTFPRDFPWSGRDIGQQIGNAVPPRLGVHLLGAALDLRVDDERLNTCRLQPWIKWRLGSAGPSPSEARPIGTLR